MRFIRRILLLAIVAVVGVVGYNYWSGNGWTLSSSSTTRGIDAESATRRGAELTKAAAQKTGEAVTKLEAAVSQGALTTKIKSKMVLDDHVKARTIDVDTSGSVVTLTGVVQSNEEREHAVRLARDTDGVTRVVDKLVVRKP